MESHDRVPPVGAAPRSAPMLIIPRTFDSGIDRMFGWRLAPGQMMKASFDRSRRCSG